MTRPSTMPTCAGATTDHPDGGRAAAVPRVLFLGRLYAGHRTRFLDLQSHTERDARIRPSYRGVSGWHEGGVVERAPWVPRAVKGRARALLQAAPIASFPRPDVIWTSAADVLTPYLGSQLGPLRRPVLLDLDWTLEQQEAWASLYFNRRPKYGVRALLARMQERLLWSTVTMFLPWSDWAATSLRRHGVAGDRIRVIPPGVDLQQWRPMPRERELDARLRILFVGGDFRRKGGDMLIDVVQREFSGRCELDVVTRDPIPSSGNVRVHAAEPNSPHLRGLYADADLFVMPTRAECFGIATVEAMASGLPVIVGDVGAAREIVESGTTGWLIQPAATDLARAIDEAIARRNSLPMMGAQARRVAEQRFDGKRNADRVIEAILDVHARSRRSAGGHESGIPRPAHRAAHR